MFLLLLTYHFCLALPAAFTQPGDHLLAEPCTRTRRQSTSCAAAANSIPRLITCQPGRLPAFLSGARLGGCCRSKIPPFSNEGRRLALSIFSFTCPSSVASRLYLVRKRVLTTLDLEAFFSSSYLRDPVRLRFVLFSPPKLAIHDIEGRGRLHRTDSQTARAERREAAAAAPLQSAENALPSPSSPVDVDGSGENQSQHRLSRLQRRASPPSSRPRAQQSRLFIVSIHR